MNPDKQELTSTCKNCFFGGFSKSSPNTRFCFNEKSDKKFRRLPESDSCNCFKDKEKNEVI